MRHRLLLIVAFTLAGWVFGVLDSRIPMPSSSTVFWVGNLGSTWLVLPFLAGWAQWSVTAIVVCPRRRQVLRLRDSRFHTMSKQGTLAAATNATQVVHEAATDAVVA